MSTFTFLLLCVHACLIQIVLSSCNCGGNIGYGRGGGLASGMGLSGGLGAGYGFGGAGYSADIGSGLTGSGIVYNNGLYGAIGEGELAVSGELPVGGATTVAGQVPVIGAVQFNGHVPASGLVSLEGHCGCGCHNTMYY